MQSTEDVGSVCEKDSSWILKTTTSVYLILNA